MLLNMRLHAIPGVWKGNKNQVTAKFSMEEEDPGKKNGNALNQARKHQPNARVWKTHAF